MPIDRAQALLALARQLRSELEGLTNAQRTTQEGAVHEENRAENDKDTRAIEAQYLARGLAQRVEDLQEAVGRIAHFPTQPVDPDAPIGAPSVVTVEDPEGREATYLLCAVGGGSRLEVAGAAIRVVSPAAPIGQALCGAHVDDEVAVTTGKGRETWLIQSVR